VDDRRFAALRARAGAVRAIELDDVPSASPALADGFERERLDGPLALLDVVFAPEEQRLPSIALETLAPPVCRVRAPRTEAVVLHALANPPKLVDVRLLDRRLRFQLFGVRRIGRGLLGFVRLSCQLAHLLILRAQFGFDDGSRTGGAAGTRRSATLISICAARDLA
jgi:hypothetical protein